MYGYMDMLFWIWQSYKWHFSSFHGKILGGLTFIETKPNFFQTTAFLYDFAVFWNAVCLRYTPLLPEEFLWKLSCFRAAETVENRSSVLQLQTPLQIEWNDSYEAGFLSDL